MSLSRSFGRYWFGKVGPSGYGFHTTAEQIAADNDATVRGRVVLITGAATGIGFEAARVLALHGATVWVTARSADKANKAAAAIRESVPGADVKTLAVDLSSLKDVKRAADEFLASGSKLHVLVNNAGVMACPYERTADGIEMQFGTNHAGHFALSLFLLPALTASAPARVVTLSSMAHAMAPAQGIQFPGPLDEEATYSAWTAYGRSKLANILFARGFNARYAAAGVTAYSLHPGAIKTELSRHLTGGAAIANAVVGHFSKSVPEGAATTLFCAVSPKAVAGEYHDESNVELESPHRKFRDREQVDILWKVSQQLVQQHVGVAV